MNDTIPNCKHAATNCGVRRTDNGLYVGPLRLTDEPGTDFVPAETETVSLVIPVSVLKMLTQQTEATLEEDSALYNPQHPQYPLFDFLRAIAWIYRYRVLKELHRC